MVSAYLAAGSFVSVVLTSFSFLSFLTLPAFLVSVVFSVLVSVLVVSAAKTVLETAKPRIAAIAAATVAFCMINLLVE